MSGELQLTGDSAVFFFFFFVGLIFGSVGLLCFVVVVVLCEGGEGGVGPFKILRKHLRKEGKGVSAGRVDVSRDPVACGVCVVGKARACLRQR